MTDQVQAVRLLHVEDNEDYRNWMETTLRLEPTLPFELVSVGTLQEALSKLKTDYFDLILLDWSLPDATGEESIALIRATNPLPLIIVFTGHAEDEIIVAAKKAGADSFLLKSTNIQTILVSLHFAATQGQSKEELARFIEGMIARLEVVTDRLSER